MLPFKALLISLLLAFSTITSASMESWSDSPNKKNIIDFVKAVSTKGSPDYVPPAKRIAVFDNDGTLWSERPVYFQVYFIRDRLKQMLPDHPEWKTEQPYKALLEGDVKTLAKAGKEGLLELVMTTHANMTTEEFSSIVKDWLATARHPEKNRPFTELVYQPMLELLDYLRDNQFKVYIVSGGGIEFMRPWTEQVYGVPAEQVIGSSIKSKFEIRDGKPVLVRLSELNFIDDKEGKPVGINQHIGRRPIAAFGNSDGDLQMLQWTAAGKGKRLMAIIHHTDAEREYAYDRESHIGKLDKAMDESKAKGWTLINMKNDWKQIYPN